MSQQSYTYTCTLRGLLTHLAGDTRFTVLGLFNVVQFANSACNATDDSRTGVCFTGSECEAKGGRAGGVCAAGFGVCCICKGDRL